MQDLFDLAGFNRFIKEMCGEVYEKCDFYHLLKENKEKDIVKEIKAEVNRKVSEAVEEEKKKITAQFELKPKGNFSFKQKKQKEEKSVEEDKLGEEAKLTVEEEKQAMEGEARDEVDEEMRQFELKSRKLILKETMSEEKMAEEKPQEDIDELLRNYYNDSASAT